jgi:hypothetical protein
MKIDYNLVEKSIADSGGVEADLIMDRDRGPERRSFMGSDHLPTWFCLKPN